MRSSESSGVVTPILEGLNPHHRHQHAHPYATLTPRSGPKSRFALAEDFASPLRMADEVPLTLNFKELKAKYPKGKLEDIGFGDGSAMFTLPNKMRFIGVDEPDTVQAGQLTFCE